MTRMVGAPERLALGALRQLPAGRMVSRLAGVTWLRLRSAIQREVSGA
jgi:hypothetical protein